VHEHARCTALDAGLPEGLEGPSGTQRNGECVMKKQMLVCALSALMLTAALPAAYAAVPGVHA
ncbi:hypothetical protein ALP42_02758, partial [Pseudomonas savastanoi pv. nerii]